MNKEEHRDAVRIIEDIRESSLTFFSQQGHRFYGVLERTWKSLSSGGKILIFGNGGSASQAQHFAAELVNRFQKDRRPLAALALTTDTSALTSIANDASYDHVFRRQIEALGKSGDVALGLSTSGNSLSVVKAMETAREMGMVTVALTGRGGGRLAPIVDYHLEVPSTETPRIQEVHLLLLHLLAQGLEDNLARPTSTA